MPSKKLTLPDHGIDNLIREIRGQKVILDSDLARVYSVSTKAFNQAVKRNLARFPADFIFRLSKEEAESVRVSRSQTVTLKRGQNVKYLPYAYTEHGALMAANVLNSPKAVTMSLYVIRAFVKSRDEVSANSAIMKRLAQIDNTLFLHDSALRDLYQKLRPLLAPLPEPQKPRIGFTP
jgi:phage regulator Rha-like protein